MENLIQNPMMLLQQINQFKQTLNGDPEQIVRQMVNSGQISQVQLNNAQKMATEMMKILNG